MRYTSTIIRPHYCLALAHQWTISTYSKWIDLTVFYYFVMAILNENVKIHLFIYSYILSKSTIFSIELFGYDKKKFKKFKYINYSLFFIINTFYLFPNYSSRKYKLIKNVNKWKIILWEKDSIVFFT